MPDRRPAQYARCSTCGEASFPVHTLSPCGHDAPPTLHDLVEPGEVYSWTRSHGPDGSALIAMVDFLGGELRVTAPVSGLEAVEIGDRLVVQADDQTGFALSEQ